MEMAVYDAMIIIGKSTLPPVCSNCEIELKISTESYHFAFLCGNRCVLEKKLEYVYVC
jgi:predicted RNA-binding Zn-ribbon protein involved in translation (DUF1610 family)